MKQKMTMQRKRNVEIQMWKLLTDELLDDAERHDDQRDAEVGNGQRHEEIISDVTKFAFYSDRHADEHVTGHPGNYQGQQQQHLPAPLISYVRHLCANDTSSSASSSSR